MQQFEKYYFVKVEPVNDYALFRRSQTVLFKTAFQNTAKQCGQGLSCVDVSVAVVQENVQTLQQNMLAHQISQQLEGLKKRVIEGLCAADKTRPSLQKLLDGLTKVQQIIVEQ